MTVDFTLRLYNICLHIVHVDFLWVCEAFRLPIEKEIMFEHLIQPYSRRAVHVSHFEAPFLPTEP